MLIPRRLAEERRRRRAAPMAPFFGVYYGLHDVTGQRAAPADLFQALGKHRRSDIIRWIAAVSRWTAEDGALLPDNQVAMAKTMLPEVLRDKLLEHLRRAGPSNWCVFHRRQLWFLLQAALLACKEDTPAAEEETLRWAVGECCLMSSDVLQQLETKEPLGQGPDEANRWITSLCISFLDGKDRLEVLARAQSFWFDLPADPRVRHRFEELNVPDFNGAFAAKYGLPFQEFFLILFTLYLGFETHAMREKNPLLLDEAAYLNPMFGKDNVQRALALVSQRPDELALKLMGSPRQNWATDSTPLRENPVIQVFDGKHACPDIHLLHRCLTDKVYFLLQKAYPDRTFGQLFGYVFEEYVNRLFRRFSYEGDILARTFYAAPRFQGREDEAGDGIVAWRRSALVMEYKARLLTTREKFGGMTEVTLAGIEDIVGKEGSRKGVYQLARVIKRLLVGEKAVAGSPHALDLKDCPRIHPVLVTYEEAVGLESVRQQAETKFMGALQREGARSDQVGHLLILTVEEVEILEKLALDHSPEDLIADYVNYVVANPKDRAGSFRSFVYNGKYNAPRPSPGSSMVEECYRKAMDAIGEELNRRYAEVEASRSTDVDTPAA